MTYKIDNFHHIAESSKTPFLFYERNLVAKFHRNRWTPWPRVPHIVSNLRHFAWYTLSLAPWLLSQLSPFSLSLSTPSVVEGLLSPLRPGSPWSARPRRCRKMVGNTCDSLAIEWGGFLTRRFSRYVPPPWERTPSAATLADSLFLS